MDISLSDLSKYFGLTDFTTNLELSKIVFSKMEFYEEFQLAAIHLDEGFLFNSHSNIFEVTKRGTDYHLDNKGKYYPIYQSFDFSIENCNVLSEETTTKKINHVSFEIVERTINCTLKINSIKRYSDLNSWEASTDEHIMKTVDFSDHKILVLKLPEIENIHGIRNLLVQYFENNILGVDQLCEILTQDNEVIIFPKLNDSISFINNLHVHVDYFITYLRDYCYDQFYNCICADGCFNCIYDTRFDQRGEELFSKNELFKMLAKLRKEESIDELISVRNTSEKIAANRFKEIISFWQKNILRILQQSAGFSIAKVFPIVKGKLERNTLGICKISDQIVVINEELAPLNLIVEVIAHEYTHNWQVEYMHSDLRGEGIPFEGKLFIEGFAQWIAFRIMDYWGLMNNMKEITLRGVDSTNPDEYGLGFRICRFIEENYGGYFAVIEFIKNGEIFDRITNKLVTKKEIIVESNLITFASN